MPYTAPVLRRRSFVFGIVGTWIAFLVGLFVLAYDFVFVAVFFTIFVASLFVATALYLFVPTHIEVRPAQITLVARKTTTTYAPTDMAIRCRRPGQWDFIRRKTGRTLATFGDPDQNRVEQTFLAVGVEILP
jgi:hypothetical protein